MAKSILLYGETGTFKTSQIKYLARYIYERYGKTTRVIFTGASDGDLTKPEENAGIIESYRISSLTIPSRRYGNWLKGIGPGSLKSRGSTCSSSSSLQRRRGRKWGPSSSIP